MQRYKTVVTPAKKIFEAFFKEMENPEIPCQRYSCFAYIYKCIFNAQSFLETNFNSGKN